jgi:hypothetical protein
MEWLANNWFLVLVIVYAMASEAVGESNLPANSVWRLGVNAVGAGIRAATGQSKGAKP